MGLPLLQLPLLARKEIILSMNIQKLISFAKISKRSKELVKTFFPKNHVEQVKVRIGMNAYVKLYCRDGSEFTIPIRYSGWKKATDIVYYNTHRYEFRFDSKAIELIKNVTDNILEIFHGTLCLMDIDGDQCEGHLETIARWLETKESLHFVYMSGTEMKDNDLKYFIQNIKITEKFFCILDQPSNCNEPIHPKFQMEFLRIGAGGTKIKWATMEDIPNFDCIQMQLSIDCNENQLNKFLKGWVNGEHNKRLEYLRIRVEELDMDLVTKGIEVERMEANVVREYIEPDYYGAFQIEGGIDIRNEENVVATIKHFPDRGLFYFIVFDDKSDTSDDEFDVENYI